MQKRGKFIVLEGTDGSGKATQTALLKERLEKEGYKVETISFPRHGEDSAKIIDLYLKGFFGEATKSDPKLISAFYAIDRLMNKNKINSWLNEGKIVIADRYSMSNMGHQGAKIKNYKKRIEFFNWIYDLEFKKLELPKPDLILLLDVPIEIAFKLIEKKEKREYLGKNKRDSHEKNLYYLKKVQKAYLHAAKLFNWKIIKCHEKGKLLSKEEINDNLYKIVSNFLKN